MHGPPRNRWEPGTASVRRCWPAGATKLLVGIVLLAASGNASAQNPGRVADAVDRPAVRAQNKGKGAGWLSFALVGGVVVLAVGASLLFLNTRKRPVQLKLVGTWRPASVCAPPMAAPAAGVDPTAICVKPPPNAEPGWPAVGDNLEALHRSQTTC
jgi:hypothetical protein